MDRHTCGTGQCEACDNAGNVGFGQLAVLAAALILLLWVLSGCTCSVQGIDPQPIGPFTCNLRVMSLNVAGGFDARYQTDAAHEAQRAFIAAQNPDIVFLQEAVGNPMVYAPDVGGTMMSAIEGKLPDGQTIGNATWVRAGIKVRDHWDVPLDFGGQWQRWATVVKVFGSHLIMGTHLDSGADSGDTMRLHQLAMATVDNPEVAVGDFNMLADVMPHAMDGYVNLLRNGTIDQAWSRIGGTATLIPTHGEAALVSDHPYAVVANIPYQCEQDL